MTFGMSSLVYAASDGKHRPASHPVVGREAESRVLPRDEWYAHVGRMIRRERVKRGWSQRRLGRIFGTSNVTVCKWEAAAQRIDAWTIDRLERLFGTRLRP